MAQRSAGRLARNAAAPSIAATPSTSSISASSTVCASAWELMPDSASRLMVSMPRTPWMVGRKASTSSPCRSAQVVQAPSAAAIELTIVPSRSNSKAAKLWPSRVRWLMAGPLLQSAPAFNPAARGVRHGRRCLSPHAPR